MHHIEPLAARHVRGAGEVLCQAFPESLWAVLGRQVVEAFLGSFVAQPGGFGCACLCGDHVVGFVVGAEDASQHRAVLLRRAWGTFLLHTARRIARSPRLAGRLMRYAGPYLWSLGRPIARSRNSEGADAIPPASLVLLGVETGHRRQGIADRLTRAFLEEMARRGVQRMKLVVAVDNEPAVALYHSRGWRQAGAHPSPGGGSVYRLIYDLTSPRPLRPGR